MSMKEIRIAITTDSSGDSTDDSDVEVFGWLEKVVYKKTDFADGVDIVLSVQETPWGVAETLVTWTDLNASEVNYPVVDRDDTSGTSETGQPTRHLVTGKLRLVTSSGGATTTGLFILYIENAE